VSDERARLFVALELPVPIRSALGEWARETVREARGLRLIAPQDLHVTLCFLGWRAESEIGDILDACHAVAGNLVAELTLGDAVWLPARRPRVLAAELEDPDGALAAAQSALSQTLQAGGWYVPESRPFLAHVTVARVAKGARPRVQELPAPPPVVGQASRVTLYRSRLSPSGARYEPLGTVELGSSGGASDPISVVRRFHAEQARAYAHGDMDGVTELLSEEVVWHVPGRSAIAGEHRGRAAVLDYLAKRREMTNASFRVTVHGVAMIDDRVVQLARGRAERGGRELGWETVGVFSVRGGQIAECWLIAFDQAAFDDIWR
jgi:RNA 2',3'-cyclic 3'-phosphodiesterase